MLAFIDIGDLMSILFLVFLEGILSVDNAVVLAAVVHPLPPAQRRRALTWGMWGAFGFRVLAVALAGWLMQATWIKVVGGAYLVFLALKYVFNQVRASELSLASVTARSFWMTVVTVEAMDIVFSADSILAAVAVSPKYWVVVTGGILGIVTMRFAAGIFSKLMDSRPRMEACAHVLVALIGTKLVLEGLPLGLDFHSASSPLTWAFWGLMGATAVWGFVAYKPQSLEVA